MNGLDVFCLIEYSEGDINDKEAEDKAESCVKPLRLLETVPYKVGYGDHHTEKQNYDKRTGSYLLSESKFLGAEEERRKNYDKQAAIEPGETVDSYGIVRGGQELEEKIEKFELHIYFPRRIGELILTELQGIVSGEDDNGRNCNRDNGEESDSDEGLEKMILFVIGVVYTIVGMSEHIVEII